jgi:hypothetical protein
VRKGKPALNFGPVDSYLLGRAGQKWKCFSTFSGFFSLFPQETLEQTTNDFF